MQQLGEKRFGHFGYGDKAAGQRGLRRHCRACRTRNPLAEPTLSRRTDSLHRRRGVGIWPEAFAVGHNVPVGKHRGGTPAPFPTRRLAMYAMAVVVTALAWLALVYLAIQLGPSAKAADLAAWLLLVVATLGAIGCLFLTLIFGGKALEVIRHPRPQPDADQEARPHEVALPGGKHGRR